MSVAVITGAGSGLGAAMADVFAGAGMTIVALDIDGDRADETAERLGGDSMAMRVDVADRASLEAAAKTTMDAFGGCDIVCANVGVQQFGAVDRLTEADWRWVLDVNVLGPVNTVAAFLPLLRARDGGDRHIVLTSSSAALTPSVRLAAYTASKFAVMGYGEVLRQELAPEGIGVSIVFPGGMMTRHLESSAAARPSEIGEWKIADDDIQAMLANASMTNEEVLTAEQAVRNLLREVTNNEQFVVTHGAYREVLQARHQAILDAYDRAQD